MIIHGPHYSVSLKAQGQFMDLWIIRLSVMSLPLKRILFESKERLEEISVSWESHGSKLVVAKNLSGEE